MLENSKILFVDDEKHNCKLFKRYFAKNKFVEVITALSVKDAKFILENTNGITILVTDLRMPDDNGHNLLSYSKNYHPSIYRVLTTANLSEVEELMMNQNMVKIIQNFLTKPWNSAEIKGLISYST
jgi:DNA-binding NtrC family response regulator